MGAVDVFISYSRASADTPPDDLAADRLLERPASIATTNDLVTAIEARFAGSERFKIWRDSRSIPAATDWHERLDGALVSCEAAILLLSQESLDESAYVRWETSVLMFRHRMANDVAVIPVLIGTTTDDLRDAAFHPARVDGLQVISIEPGADTAAVTDVVDRIQQILVDVTPSEDSETAGWVSNVERALTLDGPVGMNDGWLAGVRALLPASLAARVAGSSVPIRALARTLISIELTFLYELWGSLLNVGKIEHHDLRRNLLPMWIRAELRAELRDQIEQGERRVIRIPADQSATGIAIVRRLYPNLNPKAIVSCSLAATSTELALADLERWFTGRPEGTTLEARRKLSRTGLVFVVLDSSGGGQLVRDVTDRLGPLLAERPWLVVLAMVGNAGAGADHDIKRVMKILPPDEQHLDDICQDHELFLDIPA